jgi:hypothetical protein
MILDLLKDEEGGNDGSGYYNNGRYNEAGEEALSVDEQWKLYIRYWACQCVRIHHSYGLDIAYFMKYRPHFMTVFSTFKPYDSYYVKIGAQPAEGMEIYDPQELAKLLAGSLSFITQYSMTPVLAAELIREVYLQLTSDKSSKFFTPPGQVVKLTFHVRISCRIRFGCCGLRDRGDPTDEGRKCLGTFLVGTRNRSQTRLNEAS